MKRLVVLSFALVAALAAPAAAAPYPAKPPASDAGIGTACTSVIGNNPNASDTGHQSEQGATHFSDVGQAMCF